MAKESAAKKAAAEAPVKGRSVPNAAGVVNTRALKSGIHSERVIAPVRERFVRELAQGEGILVGHSSGAALWGVREMARRIQRGVIVTVLADGGGRYLSTGLYGREGR